MQLLAETITAAQWGVVISPTMINWIRLGLGPLDIGVYGQLQFFVYFSLSTVMQLLLKYIQSLFYYKIKIAGLLSVFKKTKYNQIVLIFVFFYCAHKLTTHCDPKLDTKASF